MSVTVTIPAWVDGVLTPVEKLEAHLKGLRHKAVSVFVIAGGEVLIQRRALGKYHTPGLWANTCCTHPEWGETAAACAVRRLREELGKQLARRLAGVREGAREQEVGDGGQRVLIGGGPDQFARQRFRRHIHERAHEEAGARETLIGSGVRVGRDAEIEHFHVVRGGIVHHVFRLQIAVHDADIVCGLNGAADL